MTIGGVDISTANLPLKLVVALLLVVAPGFYWLANEHSANVDNAERIHQIETVGTPRGLAAIHDLEVLERRVTYLESFAALIAANGNRITRLEAQIERLQDDLNRLLRREVDKGPAGPPITPP